MTAFPNLAATLREIASQYWRDGDHLQASAMHARAILLEAGVGMEADAQPSHDASLDEIREAMQRMDAGRVR